MKKQMERKASDNTYLHKDFHISLNLSLIYLEKHFGKEAITEYLTEYAENYFSPMSIAEIRAYLQGLYKAEDAKDAVSFKEESGKLCVMVNACPAVAFLKTPSPHYRLTTEVIYSVLARKSGLKFTLRSYDDQTGAAQFEFEEGKV